MATPQESKNTIKIRGFTISFRTMPQDMEALAPDQGEKKALMESPELSFAGKKLPESFEPNEKIAEAFSLPSLAAPLAKTAETAEKPPTTQEPFTTEKEEPKMEKFFEIKAPAAGAKKQLTIPYKTAKSFYKKGLYQEAIIDFQNVLKANPKHWRANWFLKRAQLKLLRQRARNQEIRQAQLQKQIPIKEVTPTKTLPSPPEKEILAPPAVSEQKIRLKMEEIKKEAEEKAKQELSQKIQQEEQKIKELEQKVALEEKTIEKEQKAKQELARELESVRQEKQEEQARMEAERQNLLVEQKRLEESAKQNQEQWKLMEKYLAPSQTQPEAPQIIEPSAPIAKEPEPFLPVETKSLATKTSAPILPESQPVPPQIIEKEKPFSPPTFSLPQAGKKISVLYSLRSTRILIAIFVLALISASVIYGIGLWQNQQEKEPSSPITSQEVLPPSLVPASKTEIITLKTGQKKNFANDLKMLLDKEETPGSITRVLIKLTDESQEQKYLSLGEVADLLQITFPTEILASLGSNYTLFIYSQKELPLSPFAAGLGRNKIGLAANISQKEKIAQQVFPWEQNIEKDLDALFMGKKISFSTQTQWADISYLNYQIRSLFLPDEHSSLNYSFINDTLVITTSLETIKTIIDKMAP